MTETDEIVLPEKTEDDDGWNKRADAESVHNCRSVDIFQIRLQHNRSFSVFAHERLQTTFAH